MEWKGALVLYLIFPNKKQKTDPRISAGCWGISLFRAVAGRVARSHPWRSFQWYPELGVITHILGNPICIYIYIYIHTYIDIYIYIYIYIYIHVSGFVWKWDTTESHGFSLLLFPSYSRFMGIPPSQTHPCRYTDCLRRSIHKSCWPVLNGDVSLATAVRNRLPLFSRLDWWIVPSGNLLHSYWRWPSIVDFSTENDGSLHSSVSHYQRVLGDSTHPLGTPFSSHISHRDGTGGL